MTNKKSGPINTLFLLQLVGLAFEIHDSYMTKKSKGSGDSAIQEDNAAQDVNPGYLDIFHYSFTYVGVLTGTNFILFMVIVFSFVSTELNA